VQAGQATPQERPPETAGPAASAATGGKRAAAAPATGIGAVAGTPWSPESRADPLARTLARVVAARTPAQDVVDAAAALPPAGRVLSRVTWEEFKFGIAHPIVAAQIKAPFSEGEQPAEVETPSTSSLAVRFTVNLRADRQTQIAPGGLIETAAREGSEVNAMRHVVWSAINAQRFGADLAKRSADSHEVNPKAIDGVDPATQSFATLGDADQSIDLSNNILGRTLGASGAAGAKQLAAGALKLFRDQGLWVAERQRDGTFKAVRSKLRPAAFADAWKKLTNLNELGLTPSGVARWEKAREQEREAERNAPPAGAM
jgi:hypothetical protein